MFPHMASPAYVSLPNEPRQTVSGPSNHDFEIGISIHSASAYRYFVDASPDLEDDFSMLIPTIRSGRGCLSPVSICSCK